MDFKLYKIQKYDDFGWERNFKFIKVGKYWLLDFSLCKSVFNYCWGTEFRVAPVYPLKGSFVGMCAHFGKCSFYMSLLSDSYDWDEEICEPEDTENQNG